MSTYDSADTPVLIKIPDLSPSASLQKVAPKRAVPEPAGAAPPAKEHRSHPPTTHSKRNKRRIHRSHLPTGPKTAAATPPAPQRSSKAYVAVLLVVLLCLAYVFLTGDSETAIEPAATDDWVGTPLEPEAVAGTDAGVETSSDLWPADDGLADAEQPLAPPVDRASAPLLDPPSIPNLQTETQPRNEPLGLLDPPMEVQSPNLAAPAQQVESATTGWPADPPTQPAGGMTSPARSVSFPGHTDGAFAPPATAPTAKISGLRARQDSSSEQLLDRRFATPSVPQRNHERLQTSLY